MDNNIKYVQIDNGSVYKSSVAEEIDGVIGRAIATQLNKYDAEFICTAINEYDKLKEDNKMLLEAIKGCYNLFEAEYEDLSDQGKRIRLKVIDAIQTCNGEDEEETKRAAKEISDKLLKNINVITDQYRKDHNIKPL